MHAYFLIRGIKQRVDELITQLQGVYLPFKFRQKGEKELKQYSTQLQVRPIQLFEVVFPEECRDVVLNSLVKGKVGEQCNHKKHEKFLWGLRKMLGINKLKPYNTDNVLPQTAVVKDMDIMCIGEKPDYWVDMNDVKHDKKVNDDCFEGL